MRWRTEALGENATAKPPALRQVRGGGGVGPLCGGQVVVDSGRGYDGVGTRAWRTRRGRVCHYARSYPAMCGVISLPEPDMRDGEGLRAR